MCFGFKKRIGKGDIIILLCAQQNSCINLSVVKIFNKSNKFIDWKFSFAKIIFYFIRCTNFFNFFFAKLFYVNKNIILSHKTVTNKSYSISLLKITSLCPSWNTCVPCGKREIAVQKINGINISSTFEKSNNGIDK